MSNQSCHKGKGPTQKVFSKESNSTTVCVAFSQIYLQQDYSPIKRTLVKMGPYYVTIQ